MRSRLLEIARIARIEYSRQPGFLGVALEGEPAIGLRYRFADPGTAARFFALREAQNHYVCCDNLLDLDGSDVIEVWDM